MCIFDITPGVMNIIIAILVLIDVLFFVLILVLMRYIAKLHDDIFNLRNKYE